MQPLNRVCFEIAKDPALQESPFAKVVYRILDWLKRRPFIEDASLVLDLEKSTSETLAGPTALVESILVAENDRRGWGVRYSHQDTANEWLRWIGEVTLWDDGGPTIYYNNTIGLLQKENYVAPVSVTPSNPTLNRELLAEFKGLTRHGHRLFAKPHSLGADADNAALFVKILKNPKRSHPVVYVTPDANRQQLADALSVAKALAGMAHVVVAESPDTTEMLGQAIPSNLNCFNGGIRIYWPDYHRNQDPQRHPLFLNWQVLEMGERCSARLVELIARQAVLRMPEDYVSWADLKAWSFRQSIQNAEQEGDTRQMLELFEDENRRQHEMLLAAQEEIARLTGILISARQQVDQLAQGLRSLDASIASDDCENISTAVEDAEEHRDNPSVDDISRKPDEFTTEVEQDDAESENPKNDSAPDISDEKERSPYASWHAFDSARKRSDRLIRHIGGWSNPSPVNNNPKPETFLMSDGTYARSGYWVYDPNNDYGYGKIIQINSGPVHSDASDKHKVWFYKQGKKLIFGDFQLRNPTTKIVPESDVPIDIRNQAPT